MDAIVAANFADSSPLLNNLLFENIGEGRISYDFARESALPTVAYRSLNGSYNPSFGKVKTQQEPIKLLGATIKIDTALAGFASLDEALTQGNLPEQARMHLRALSLKVQQTILKGDSTTNEEELDGLQSRIGNGSSQLITPGTSNGGDPLQINNLTEAVLNTRDATHILMPLKMFIRLQQYANSNSNSIIRASYDEFGRLVYTFAGLPILPIDEDGEGNEILPFTEANPNASATATGSTSIYVISALPERFFGIQQAPIRVRNFGESTESPHLILKMDWNHGIVMKDARSVTRIAGISDEAITT